MFPPLYPILDVKENPEEILPLADALAAAGVALLQIRAKKHSAGDLLRSARQISARLQPRGVKIVVNDRPDVALLAGASGVHVGQHDLPVEDARKLSGPALWVGVSTHNADQLRAAASTSADYIAVGPVFPTGTKENPDPVVGLEFLRLARAATKKPLVAIGGITVESAEAVFRAGADSVAVIRDLSSADDPGSRARAYLEIAARVCSSRS